MKSNFVWALGLVCAGAFSGQAKMTVLQTIEGISIFGRGSPEFSAIVNNLGAADILTALGPAADMFVAIRNDSKETVASMRVRFEVPNGQKTIQWISLRDTTLVPGDVKLVAPDVLDKLAAGIGSHSVPGLGPGASTVTPPLVFLNGETTVSVDSVTLNDGTFKGEDKVGFFDRLVETDKAIRSFFANLLAMKGRTAGEVTSVLKAQRDSARSSINSATGLSGLNIPALEQSKLLTRALSSIQAQGLAATMAWAEAESNRLAAKPILHR